MAHDAAADEKARGRELYVYYRVHDDSAAAALPAAQALQARLRTELPALSARLLRRPGTADGLQTWMEIYSLDADGGGIDPEQQALIERRAADALAAHLAGPRHVEVFVAFGTDA